MPAFVRFNPRHAPLVAVPALLAAAAAAAWAQRTGFLADLVERLQQTVDPAVVVLFVPLCAIVFAIVVEAARIAVSGDLPDRTAARRRPPRGWVPGHRLG